MNKKNRILSLILSLLMLVSNVSVPGVVLAETVATPTDLEGEHQHSFTQTWDADNHWTYCTTCGEPQAVGAYPRSNGERTRAAVY